MTLTSQTNRVQYSGDGAQIAFPITFVFWLTADIQAVHTDANGTETIWVVGAHFTLTGGSGSTGTLTVKTSPTDYTPKSGETLTITSNLDDTQDTSLPEGGPFPSSSVEQQLDKIVRLIQQKAEALGRSIKLKLSSTFTELTIPDPSASKFLRWNTAATALENADITGSGSIGLPVSIADGGTNAITAAAARTNLGLVIGTDVLANIVEDTTPQLGGALDTNDLAINFSEGAAVASASAPNIWAADGNTVHITGSTGITDFANAPRIGASRWLVFDSTPAITHGAGITIMGGANWTAAAGDMAFVYADAVDAFRLVPFQISGKAVVGQLVQVVNTQDGEVATGTTILPFDDTIPQNTEGDEYMTLAVTPTNSSNILEITMVVLLASSAANNMTIALFQDATANALAAAYLKTAAANEFGTVTFKHRMTAATTSETTFKVRAGEANGNTTTFNGQAAGRLYGGVTASSITIKEITA